MGGWSFSAHIYHHRNQPAEEITRVCHVAGGELEQIQFLLGHISIQTTEYLGCKQKLRIAVNDNLGIEPDQAL